MKIRHLIPSFRYRRYSSSARERERTCRCFAAKVAVSLEYDDNDEALRTDDLAVDGTATEEIADKRTSERATNAS